MSTPWLHRRWFAPRANRPIVKARPRPLAAELLEARVQPVVWTDLAAIPASPTDAPAYLHPESYRAFNLDPEALRAELAAAPLEFTGATPYVLTLPRPDGTTERFAMVNSPVMAPELAAQFPQIQTWAGQGIDNPASTIRMDVTPQGFHAQVLSPDGGWYIDPYYHLQTDTYIGYFRRDLSRNDVYPTVGGVATGSTRTIVSAGAQADEDFLAFGPGSGNGGPTENGGGAVGLRSGTQLRVYRLANAATGEYTAFHGGTVALGQAAIVTSVNRVNQVYENDLSIRMVLVANNSTLVYTNATTDPYTNFSGGAMLGQNQTTVDSLIGSANYDIGHVYSTGGGGVAFLGCVGINANKARGVTGLSSPIGDAFYIDYVAHEVGHQFGGSHTFNTSSDPNRNGPTAYEPGSGSTIQAYAGITGPDSDLQSSSDPMFHSVSFDEIISHVDTVIPNVGTRITTGNTVPTVNGGLDYTIPARTPFVLTAVGSDPNGDTLTYSWEERDLGPATLLSTADNGSSPLFRTFLPTTDPSRTLPVITDVISGTPTPGEKLFTRNRTSNWRVTVRDNRAGGGGVNTDDVRLTVVSTGVPFAVLSPNTTGISWNGTSTQTVDWNVAGTTANGINTANVRIKLSTDGGLTYPITIINSTPNDGTEDIVVPNEGTNQARIRVEAVGNIFFDISNANFTIVPASVPVTIVRDPGQAPAVTAGPVRFVVTFGEPVTGFGAGDVRFDAGTITTGLSATVSPNGPSGASYFVDVAVTPGHQGTIGISVVGGAAAAIAGGSLTMPETTSAGELVTFDDVAPTPTFTPAPIGPTNNAALPVAVDFGEAVTGFTQSDLVLTNATATGFTQTGPGQYTFTLQPGQGAFAVGIAAGAATDTLGNVSTAAVTNTGTLDSQPPGAVLTRVSPAVINAGPAVFRVVFSEPIAVASFIPSDVSFAGSTVGGVLSAGIVPDVAPNTYLINVTGMSGVGIIRVALPAGVVTDAAGNATTVATTANADVQFDGVVPSTTLTPGGPLVTRFTTIPFTITFSEPITGFTVDDLVLTGAVGVTGFLAAGDGMTFTFNLNSSADGPYSLTVPAGAGADPAANPTDEASVVGEFDTSGPSTTLTVKAPVFTDADAVFTVVFSEPLADPAAFTPAAVTFGGASRPRAVAVTPGPTAQTFVVTVSGMVRSGTVNVTVNPAGAGVTDPAGNPAVGTPSATALFHTTSAPPAYLVGEEEFATGAGATPGAALYEKGGKLLYSTTVVDAGFGSGVRSTTGDFNGDGVPDLVIGTGPGNPTLVRVLDATTGVTMAQIRPFEASFTGGVFVAAGDMDGDGVPELIVTPDEGGGPRVQIYRGGDLRKIADFFGIDDPRFRGGARAAVGDMTGDGRGDLVVAAGFGGGPRLTAYDGTTFGVGRPRKLFNDIFVFEQTLRNGVFVASGDVNGDGFADLVVGGGPGGAPRVMVVNGTDLLAGKGTSSKVLANFFAGDTTNRGGVRVAVKNIDGDAFADLVVGDGEGAGSRVTAYRGLDLGPASGEFAFDAYPGVGGGVYVG